MPALFVTTYEDAQGRLRHAIGEKKRGETTNSFSTGRGFKSIKEQPIKDFDSESFFFPRISNEFPFQFNKNALKTSGAVEKLSKPILEIEEENVAKAMRKTGRWRISKIKNLKK